MGLALVMPLRVYSSMVKRFKLRARKFWTLISTFVEVTGGGDWLGRWKNPEQGLVIDYRLFLLLSFVKSLAIFVMVSTPLGKNLIVIQTVFKLKYYTNKFRTASFSVNKGLNFHLVN